MAQKRVCPRDTSPLNEIHYETEKVDHCPQCGGLWCDGDELVKVVQSREQKFGEQEHQDINAVEAAAKAQTLVRDTTSEMMCIVCNKPMTRSNYSYNSGIMIDRCPDGHGVWMDRDEIERIQIFVERWEKERSRVEKNYGILLKLGAAQATSGYNRAVREGKESALKGSAILRLLDKLRWRR
ncbi:MAG: hypothetical protein FJ146_18970 [Deltaproteobacteria bacterium]|nr:hypothetical protein [Deltaproteobacteria bacterium]